MFDSILVFENYPTAGSAAELPHGITRKRLRYVAWQDYPLSFIAYAGRSTGGVLFYDQALLDRPTVERMAGHFLALLASVVANPSARLRELEMLTPAERRRLLVEWNDTAAEFPGDTCVHELVQRQVAARPDAVAVVCGPDSLTYGGLNARANQLARFLVERGAGPDVLVGVCLPRSLDLVVALLGVLKAGAAYVPLDPEYPAERLAFLLSDTAAPVVLTHAATPLPDAPSEVVALDEHWPAISAMPDTDLTSDVRPDNLAYVIYTSGSTGAPKGVQIEHRSIVNFLIWAASAFPAGDGHGSLLHSSVAFDFEIPSIFLPLLQGRDIVVRPVDGGHAAQGVTEFIRRELPVSTLKVTPSHLNMVLDAAEGDIDAVSLVVAGEPFDVRLARAVAERLGPRTTVINEYGPTETTVGCLTKRVDVDALPHAGTVPIGRPTANAAVYVVDRFDRLVPVGVPGELLVGGVGVARGYLNRPELTAQRFTVDPFSSDPCARVYRTGDIVRRLSDGDLEFVGRRDDQVKIRGFRVELGEVESVLADHEGVASCAVTVRDDAAGGKRLVAYCVPTDTVSVSALREWCARRLPAHLVPSAFVLLDALPLTANGKVDRRALPDPDGDRPELDSGFVAARGSVELAVVRIWSEVLGVARIGVHDDFFELGGHSLLATKVTARLRQEFELEVPIRALFAAPTVRELADVLVSMRSSVVPPLRPVDRGDMATLPLSFAQQRLWFLDQLEPGSREYLIPMAMRLRGRLDTTALQAALDGLVARHEPLRTVFDDIDGVAVQIIKDPSPFPLELVDLTAADGEPDLDGILAAETSRPMDLRHGPLVRGVLVTMGSEDFVLALTLHHIVADGWSFGVLTREFRELYAAAVERRPARLSVLPVQYVDFAVWQREWLQGDVLAGQLSFWRKSLAGVQPLELPGDRPRPAVRSAAGSSVTFRVSPDVTAGLRRLAAEHDASLFMVLLAVFQVLLARHSGQSDIAVGSPVANRGRAEIECLIGFFVNTVVFRGDLSGNPEFGDFVVDVRERALDALGHQDLPFERLVDEVAPERDLGRGPLFGAMLVLHNAETGTWELQGLRVETLPVESSAAKFDLTLSMVEEDGGLGARLVCSTDLFDRPTIERMAEHFLSLSASVVTDSSVRLSELEMLTAGERRQFAEWNENDIDFPHDVCVHELVEQRVVADPVAVAVVFGSKSLTYGELNTRANQLAWYLRQRGAGPGVMVGVCVERSLDLVVALLGVLKTGAAYVPLDPDYPSERLTFILADAAVTVVVTQDALRDRVQAGDVVVLDQDWAAISAMPDADPVTGARPDDLAYVIYTSGSTGQPKGAQIEHRSVVNVLAAMGEAVPLSAGESALASTATTFDISVVEFFLPLMSGARVVIASDEDVHSPVATARLIREHDVVFAQATPSIWRHIVQRLDGRIERMTAVTAGEPVSEDLWARMVELFGNVINGYGPTEATIYATMAMSHDAAAGVTIGRPLANTKAYVVDRFDQLVPIGVPGELLIGGVGVGRGYLNRPELTAQRFTADPFSSDPSARVYRTGDIVRWLPDGRLDFVGRLDDQVKVRGFRIELGEIESVLARHPNVASCVVVVREDVPGDKRLVAYCVPVGMVGVSVLREWCERSLPGYLVPSGFMFVDVLPLMASGKVDRRALPLPSSNRPELDGFVAPRDAAEGVVAGVWRAVLGIDRVGVHDNFFALGGDSILSIQVVARLKGHGMLVTPRMMFQHQTVAGLVAAAGVAAPVVAEQGKVTGEVVLSPVQRWFFQWCAAEPNHFNQSVLLDVDDLDIRALRAAVDAVVEHHDMVRARFSRGSDGWTQCIADDAGEGAVSECDLSGAADVDAALRELADGVQRSLHLAEGPVFRIVLVELGAARGQRLLMVIHHLVVDGVSWRVLLEDLGRAYEGLPLPPKTTSFREWSARLAERAKSVDVGYWDRELPATRVPRDGFGVNSVASVGVAEGSWGVEETGVLLRDVARVFGTSTNDALLMAVAWAFREWTGESACLVELEGHGREDLFADVDLSRTVGWFTSIFPVVIDLGPATDPVECVKTVAAQLSEVPDKGLVYGIGRYLGGKIPVQQTPEISFNYLGQYKGRVPGLGRYADNTEPTGDPIDPATIRHHVLDITADVRDGRLRVAIRYSENLHHRATVRGFVDRILGALERLVHASRRYGPRRSSMIALNRSRSARTMYVMHEISGNVTGYTRLAELLEPHLRVVGIEAACVDGESEPKTNVGAMAEDYWRAVRDTHDGSPLLLAGWSFGGALAVEVAALAQAAGQAVDLVAAFDTYLGDDSAPRARRPIAAATKLLEGLARVSGDRAWRDVARRDFADWLRDLNLAEQMVSLEHGDLMHHVRILLAHWTALGAYEPSELSCRTLVFEAEDSTWPHPLRWGWESVTSGPLTAHMTPGSHFTMLQPPHVTAIADRMVSALSASVAGRA
ncbi:amino acid adenylation domain-containing protein [Amycolatopsis pigmentata]|uniref:Amino acid adenylation domain-containing protein n=1 Tax=Amycolatopsis pigmentata TaxID=450801 RepID=A0ABW5FRB6_9PSEU